MVSSFVDPDSRDYSMWTGGTHGDPHFWKIHFRRSEEVSSGSFLDVCSVFDILKKAGKGIVQLLLLRRSQSGNQF